MQEGSRLHQPDWHRRWPHQRQRFQSAKCFFEIARYGHLETGLDEEFFQLERDQWLVFDNKDPRVVLLIDWHLCTLC